MSTVPTLQRDKTTGIIYMHWTDPTPRGKRGRSRRASTGTSSMDEAKVFLAQWLLLERYQPAPQSTLTVADLWSVYDHKHVQRHVASPDTLKWAWKNLSVHFGTLMLSQVSQDAVQDYEEKRVAGDIGRPSVQATVRRELNALRACFNWCADRKRKILAKDELPVFDLPDEGEPKDRWLQAEEIRRIFRAARATSERTGTRMGRGERFLWLALETAARSEAIRQLTWDRVDWQTKAIDFNLPGRKRTKKRRAVVPISTALEAPLRRMQEEAFDPKTGHVLDSEAPVLKLVKCIADHAGVPDVSPNVLRHTAATNMARSGVPLWIIAKILGNSTAMVERIYAKHQPDDLREGIERISEGVVRPAMKGTAAAA